MLRGTEIYPWFYDLFFPVFNLLRRRIDALRFCSPAASAALIFPYLSVLTLLWAVRFRVLAFVISTLQCAGLALPSDLFFLAFHYLLTWSWALQCPSLASRATLLAIIFSEVAKSISIFANFSAEFPTALCEARWVVPIERFFGFFAEFLTALCEARWVVPIGHSDAPSGHRLEKAGRRARVPEIVIHLHKSVSQAATGWASWILRGQFRRP